MIRNKISILVFSCVLFFSFFLFFDVTHAYVMEIDSNVGRSVTDTTIGFSLKKYIVQTPNPFIKDKIFRDDSFSVNLELTKSGVGGTYFPHNLIILLDNSGSTATTVGMKRSRSYLKTDGTMSNRPSAYYSLDRFCLDIDESDMEACRIDEASQLLDTESGSYMTLNIVKGKIAYFTIKLINELMEQVGNFCSGDADCIARISEEVKVTIYEYGTGERTVKIVDSVNLRDAERRFLETEYYKSVSVSSVNAVGTQTRFVLKTGENLDSWDFGEAARSYYVGIFKTKGSTNTHNALTTAYKSLRSGDKVVLVTDGMPNVTYFEDLDYNDFYSHLYSKYGISKSTFNNALCPNIEGENYGTSNYPWEYRRLQCIYYPFEKIVNLRKDEGSLVPIIVTGSNNNSYNSVKRYLFGKKINVGYEFTNDEIEQYTTAAESDEEKTTIAAGDGILSEQYISVTASELPSIVENVAYILSPDFGTLIDYFPDYIYENFDVNCLSGTPVYDVGGTNIIACKYSIIQDGSGNVNQTYQYNLKLKSDIRVQSDFMNKSVYVNEKVTIVESATGFEDIIDTTGDETDRFSPMIKIVDPLKFRSVDTKNPFPGSSGNNRSYGQNWTDGRLPDGITVCSKVDLYIKQANNSYNKTGDGPKYSIVLTPNDVRRIKNWVSSSGEPYTYGDSSPEFLNFLKLNLDNKLNDYSASLPAKVICE